MDEDNLERWKNKKITTEEAIQYIIPGNRVFVSSACSEPQALTAELIKQSFYLSDTEIVHYLTIFPEKYFKKDKAQDLFRHNALFIGDTLRDEINKGQADYTPIYASEIPKLFVSGRKYIDVALIQVSPPDNFGFCSFGVNVDIAKPIANSAYLTIAEINPMMPKTLGDSFIHMKDIDYYVYNSTPLLEYKFKEPDEVVNRIAQNVAQLIENKSTIHIGHGDIPNAVLLHLMDKKDLGMHSHFITDNIIPLIEKTVLTCRKKNYHPEKIITSFALGTKKLYDFINDNPYIEFHPSDYVCNPNNIAMNNRMVSIVEATQIDLTGQINASFEGYTFYSGIGDNVDFMRGAALSNDGKPIIVLRSISIDGKESNIVLLLKEGTGIILTRPDVHYVVTEWGVAYLHGKSIRERALELICIAHPKFRKELLDYAKKLNYIYSDQLLSCDEEGNICVYPKKYDTFFYTSEKQKVLVRPVRTTDEPLLKELYYSLDKNDRFLRFFEIKKEFPHSKTQHEVNVDYQNNFSISAFVGDIGNEKMVGIANYYLNPKNNMAEFSFVVRKEWRKKGIASFLYHHLIIIAMEKGIRGFFGTIHMDNKATIDIIKKGGKLKITTPPPGEHELFYEVLFS